MDVRNSVRLYIFVHEEPPVKPINLLLILLHCRCHGDEKFGQHEGWCSTVVSAAIAQCCARHN